MEDEKIIALFVARDETAITRTQEKYSNYCQSIAERIVGSHEDAEECVNDTWRRAWESIPPEKPSVLSTYLGMLTRHIALNRVKASMASKRGGGQVSLALEELSECVADAEADEGQTEQLREVLNRFLASLPQKNRMVFVRRYWYTDSAADIAAAYDMNENSVNALLFRMRRQLKKHLHNAGIDV